MESVIETKASMILEFVEGLRGEVHVTFEEGTWHRGYRLHKEAVEAVRVYHADQDWP
jgi:hypothetical protein